MKVDLFVGLISGTSVDGIDAVLVRFDDQAIDLLATLSHPYPAQLRDRLLKAINNPGSTNVDEVGALDTEVGEAFRDAALRLLEASGQSASHVKAIGSHGQTLRHMPDTSPRFTMQIGNPSIIAAGTGMTTVADFRRQDLALGGQGAPLVPPFHEWLFRREGAPTVVANIGGIANITILPGDSAPARGFDTGPGNTLMDAWIRKTRNLPFDHEGQWAAAGSVRPALLESMLRDAYINRPPPKSTGPEYFNLDWLNALGIAGISSEDVQATLLEFTAVSLTRTILDFAADTRTLYLCGGGARNKTLVTRINELLPEVSVESTARQGLDPDWVEACAFAWLARERMAGRTGNLPAVTGASRPSPLGGIYRS